MGQPFSARVAAEDWRREAEAWITEQVEQRGWRLTGTVERTRTRPWSTQLAVPTDAGPLWFKANCPAMAFEPMLHSELAALVPDSVDAPLAISPERGWMLTLDRGATLGDSRDATIEDWRDVLAEAARMQRALAFHGERLLATGMPDCSPGTVLTRFERLVEVLSALPDTHPAHVVEDLVTQLRAARPALADAVAVLEESPLPTTWQHGDLHPGNVLVVEGRLRLFDFGDAQWSHAVELLSVPHGLTQQAGLRWEDARDAYCEVWRVSGVDLEATWRAARMTQPVNRTLLWWRALDQATADEWREWGEAPLQHLTRVLDQ